ncbi:MAG: radical SAM family heme chaperone HemW [Alistipes sp.]|jgi:oxygen-independent coproporphyrinogen-3 oxidase|nr:radical SAM family heme chaperone HemW [Alistipes sp.]
MAGLYIHIPFCGQKCAYCDFYSRPARGCEVAFLDALEREMAFRRDFLPARRLDTIYIGGGTPSLLEPERLQGVLDRAAGLWDCSGLREVTMEANPEDLTDEYIERLAETRFDRLSIGIQSFDNGLLRLMNRRHSAARARDAVRAAQRNGFDNISIDLIFGIPGMTAAQWERSLDEAIGLGVQHISAYHLTIEPGTTFGKMARKGDLRPIPEAESERQYETLRRRLTEAGFEHYEISNFAQPGRRAVHNSAYWSGAPYLGVGPSAHSFDGGRRREWVAPDVEKYIAAAGTDAKTEGISGGIYDGETLSDTDLANERVMTALRTVDGIAAEELREDKNLEKLLSDGLLVRRDMSGESGSREDRGGEGEGCGGGGKNGSRIAIPPDKFLLSDYIIGALFE